MKLRNNKSIPFLGKNLPKRKRKTTKITAVLPKPIIDECLNPIISTPANSKNHLSPKTTSPSSTNSDYNIICPLSESCASKPDSEAIVEQSSYEEDSKLNHSLKRFSHGHSRSITRNQINSTPVITVYYHTQAQISVLKVPYYSL